MAKKKYSSRSETGESLAKDDLQLINGVGPAVEKRLNGTGIYTFSQLAALSPADIAAAIADLSGLSTERIIKQDWIGQARQQALSDSLFLESEVQVVSPAQQHRPITFTVEFLLDENNSVVSTHVLHAQSGRNHTWAGWQKTQLADFMSESVGLSVRSNEPVIPLVEEPVNAEKVETVTIEQPDLKPDEITGSKLTAPSVPISNLSGVLHLRKLEVLGVKRGGFHRTLIQNEPFDVQLTLDLTGLEMQENIPLTYKTTVYGRGQGRSGLVVGKSEGTIKPAEIATITVKENILPEGMYRLAAKVTVRRQDTKLTTKSSASGIIDGGIVQVY